MKRIVFYVLTLVVFGSCNGGIESCTTEDFDGFEMNKIELLQFRFLKDTLVNVFEPAITYKFKNKSIVSFVNGNDFTLLSFDFQLKDNLNSGSIQIKKEESKIKLGKCYTKCGYLGRALKFRFNKTVKVSCPVLKIMTDGLKKKIVDNNYIYFEGTVQNIGLFLEEQEFIFLPHDDQIINSKEDFYMKVLLVKDEYEWVAYIFYSKNEIKTNVLGNLRIKTTSSVMGNVTN